MMGAVRGGGGYSIRHTQQVYIRMHDQLRSAMFDSDTP